MTPRLTGTGIVQIVNTPSRTHRRLKISSQPIRVDATPSIPTSRGLACGHGLPRRTTILGGVANVSEAERCPHLGALWS